MKRPLYLTSGGTLSRRQNTLMLETEAGRRYVPVEQVSEIYVFGELDFNKRLLELLSHHGILVHVYSYHGYYQGTYYPREHNNSGYLILQQAAHYLDDQKRLDLAKRFVRGAINNLLAVVKYYARRGKALDGIQASLEGELVRLEAQRSIEQLMQVEGEARETYYGSLDVILQNPSFRFEQRTRRPPRNRLNALLSFGNALLYGAVLSQIYQTHLDPRIGYLHATNFRRFTLNLDVAEVFKPILVDRTILALVQRQQLREDDFDEAMGGLYLKEEGRKRFLNAWEQRMETTLYHRALGRHVSYRTLIRLELYKLEKHLMGERAYEPFRSSW